MLPAQFHPEGQGAPSSQLHQLSLCLNFEPTQLRLLCAIGMEGIALPAHAQLLGR